MSTNQIIYVATKCVAKDRDYEDMKYWDDMYWNEHFAENVREYVEEAKKIWSDEFKKKYTGVSMYPWF